mmetsp:Transcript_6417/g.16768  ORF Transcript_6417/g.16768 Transcript_6417/m.16768 type:complete len:609 (+) Transcript_6417:1-1827(+)
MHNWMHHVKRLGVDNYVLAALDERTYQFCVQAGYPSAALPPATGAAAKPKAGKGEASYYRMDHELFLRMGVQKADLLGAFVRAGYDVLLSDLDVAWLSDPRPYLDPATAPDRAALMALADVVTASDAVDVSADSEAGGWLTRQEINTGVLLFRATKGAVAVIDEWRLRMVRAIEAKQWTLQNDQLFFNHAVKQRGLVPKPASGLADALAAAGRPNARELTAHPAADVRGLFQGKAELTYSRAPPHTLEAASSGGAPAARELVRFTLATFSITEFANGHTFFVQRLGEQAGLTPFMVHTTHQFADTSAYALGKRQRLREHRLWAVDPESYFADGDFLELTGSLLRPTDIADGERLYEAHDPRRHITIDARQREVLRDALALARATGRTLIMPELQCWCDRFWNRLKGCRYATDHSLPLPFRCPMDHLFFLDKWDTAKLPFREQSFLANVRTPPAVRESVVELRLEGAAAAAPRWDGSALVVEQGACFSEVAAALSARRQPSRVLRVGAQDLRMLCPWLGSARANDEFNKAASSALHHTVRFCTAESLTPPLAEAVGGGCPWGYRPPAPLPASEAAARAYATLRADANVTAFSEPRVCRREGEALAYTCS